MTAQRNFDRRCYDLARYFLPVDTDEETICRVAQVIQDAVEDALEDMQATP